MRPSYAPRSTFVGRFARPLLLALALCDCGGVGAPPNRTAAGPESRTASVAQDSAAPAPCPAPPAVDPALFRGSWAVLTARLRELGASFPDLPGNSDTARVALCETCAPVDLVIRADTTTWCTTPAQLDSGQTRIMGIFILAGEFAGDSAAGWGRIRAGDSLLVFASGSSGPAPVVYRSGEQAVTAPAGSWMFHYCQDGAVGTRPQAQWRSRLTGAGSRNAADPARRLAAEEGGSFGWMACASGCCQFYTPPPNPIIVDPVDPARGRARDADPGQPPTWCTRS